MPVTKGGASEAAHLAHLRKVGALPDVPPPVLRDEAEHVWQWFCELSLSRGDSAVSHQEIEAWARLRGVVPASWELEALRLLEATWARVRSEAMKHG